jgi:hypothetical protein
VDDASLADAGGAQKNGFRLELGHRLFLAHGGRSRTITIRRISISECEIVK